MSQAAHFRTGEKVEFTGGGCAHFVFSFTYSKLNLKSNKIEKYFQKAVELLKQTPVTDTNKNILINALKESQKKKIVKRSDGSYNLSCRDANCSLDLSGKDLLRISYDFAL